MPLPPEPLPDGFDPDAYLASLEMVGWKLGLDRMWKLTTALGFPQQRFASVHVVGTNGKSSVTRMVAALLEAHCVPSGACLSPHTTRWTERTLIRGEEIAPQAWAEAVAQVAAASEGVNRTLEEGDIVNLDITIFLEGVHGDCNATFFVGKVDPESERLVRVTREWCA